MKKRSRGTRIFLGVLGTLLSILVLAAVIICFHAPHYLSAREPYQTEALADDGQLTVMSCNVRCATPTDLGKKSWFYRANLVVDNIRSVAPDVIGFQEVTTIQYSYLCDMLPGYDSVIEYRDNTPFFSEGCPVFYRADLYDLVDKGSFWLSETPEEMSKDWDAACYRICSYTILAEKASGKQFVVFNTHLDHVSDLARVNGIQVVLDKIAEFGGLPAVLMGDMNAAESSETYRMATENFLDVKYQLPDPVQSCTYQNWGANLDDPCIDYILISKTGLEVLDYNVCRNTYDGVYPSDHFPIYARLQLA